MTGDALVAKVKALPSIGKVKVLATDGSVLEILDVEGEVQPNGSYIIWLRAEFVDEA